MKNIATILKMMIISNSHHSKLRAVVTLYWNVLVIISLVDYVRATCQSPQYAELGRGAIIKCDFDIVNTYNVYWYRSERDINPFIRYEHGSDLPISGSGYDNASYSVDGKGSLIIFDVTTDNERAYKVLAYNRNDDISETHFVDVHTYVLPTVLPTVHGTCQSPQCAELGSIATIQCDFDINTYNVYWYRSEQDRDPFIRYEHGIDPAISGSGNDTASYSVDGNGSLIIFNVTTDNERTYKVLAYNGNDDKSETHFVDVHTHERCSQDKITETMDTNCKGMQLCVGIAVANIVLLSLVVVCLLITLIWEIKRLRQSKNLCIHCKGTPATSPSLESKEETSTEV